MQYWIFFEGGVGGDGFANLLEHADNVTPCDGKLKWRTRRVYSNDEKVAFTGSEFLSHPIVKSGDINVDLSTVEPTDYYRNLVCQGINTVIAAHPFCYKFNDRFKYRELLETNQHKICLYSLDTQRIMDDFCEKNPNTTIVQDGSYHIRAKKRFTEKLPPLYGAPDLKYDTYINIDLAWDNWHYLNAILFEIGIHLDRKYYEEYLDVSRRRKKVSLV